MLSLDHHHLQSSAKYAKSILYNIRIGEEFVSLFDFCFCCCCCCYCLCDDDDGGGGGDDDDYVELMFMIMINKKQAKTNALNILLKRLTSIILFIYEQKQLQLHGKSCCRLARR